MLFFTHVESKSLKRASLLVDHMFSGDSKDL